MIFEFSLNLMIFCDQNYQFHEFLTIFLRKMTNVVVFLDMKLLEVIKIYKHIPSLLKVPQIEHPVALYALRAKLSEFSSFPKERTLSLFVFTSCPWKGKRQQKSSNF